MFAEGADNFEHLLPTQTQTQTQTQDSQMEDDYCMYVQDVKTPWGRLFSMVPWLDTVDLVESNITVGRGDKCDIVIAVSRFPSTQSNRYINISKNHFTITKQQGSPIYITDLSKNGTFLNGNLIGRNKKNILQCGDILSVGFKNWKTYIFKTMGTDLDDYLPPELTKVYEVSSVLGRGACGEVRLVFHKVTCKCYAVKKILKPKYMSSGNFYMNDPKKIQTEVDILKSLSHPFIMGMKEIVETEDAVFLVLDYMSGGELTKRIISNQRLTESQAKFFFYQITLAVQYLHKNKITHRDLKAENVLLSSDADDAIVKVSDFGLSKMIHSDTIMQTQCGTPTYVAPEILNGCYKEYNQQVDIWSLGVILFFMLSQELPFIARERSQLYTKILHGDYIMNPRSWSPISDEARDLVRRMLTVRPWKRLTIEGVLLHPWLSKDSSVKRKVQNAVQKYLQENGNGSHSDSDSASAVPAKRARI